MRHKVAKTPVPMIHNPDGRYYGVRNYVPNLI